MTIWWPPLLPGCVGSCITGDDNELPNSADGDGPSDNELSPEAPMLTLLFWPTLLLLAGNGPGCSSSGVMFSGVTIGV